MTTTPSETNSGNIDEGQLQGSPNPIEGSVSLEVSSKDFLGALVEGYGKNGTQEGKKRFINLLQSRLKSEVNKHKCALGYNILVIYDNTQIIKSDSDRIYEAIKGLNDKTKPLLLILLSHGGEPGSAYLIGKLCRDSSNGKFVVVVPRYAKSAATLLSCAADEVHMGSLSELGPIDPQIDKMPALGLKNSIEHIASLVTKFPESGKMFASYLADSVKLIDIGYYERAAESAVQYAERLLESNKDTLASSPIEIARRLVYDYKDHGFVIDKNEAITIFGTEMVKSNSFEYDLGNSLYKALAEVEEVANLCGFSFYFIGSLDSKPEVVKRR